LSFRNIFLAIAELSKTKRQFEWLGRVGVKKQFDILISKCHIHILSNSIECSMKEDCQTDQFGRAERVKQKVDVAAGLLLCLSLVVIGIKRIDMIPAGTNPINSLAHIDGLLSSSVSLCIAGSLWLFGRCSERPDFNDLPSSKYALGLSGAGMALCFVMWWIAEALYGQ
jgi:hypothetical protein